MKYDGKEYTIKIWQGEELNHTLAIDTETTYVPFTETPDLITFQVFDVIVRTSTPYRSSVRKDVSHTTFFHVHL